MERLRFYYEKLSEFDVLFNEYVENDFESWIKQFVALTGDGSVEPKGIIWQVDDVGIFYLTDIRPGYEALAHYNFWDQKLNGRIELIQEMLRWIFENLGFHRIVAEVAMYAKPALNAADAIGFTKEGRKREATLYKPRGADEPEWWDVALFSILEHEV